MSNHDDVNKEEAASLKAQQLINEVYAANFTDNGRLIPVGDTAPEVNWDSAGATLNQLLHLLGSPAYISAGPEMAKDVGDVLRVDPAELQRRVLVLARNVEARTQLGSLNLDLGRTTYLVLAGALALVKA